MKATNRIAMFALKSLARIASVYPAIRLRYGWDGSVAGLLIRRRRLQEGTGVRGIPWRSEPRIGAYRFRVKADRLSSRSWSFWERLRGAASAALDGWAVQLGQFIVILRNSGFAPSRERSAADFPDSEHISAANGYDGQNASRRPDSATILRVELGTSCPPSPLSTTTATS